MTALGRAPGTLADHAPQEAPSPEVLRARKERRVATFVVGAPAAGVTVAFALACAGVAPSRADLAVLAVGAVLTMAGVEIGFHRYFTHRAFDARPWFAWLLAALGSMALLGPVIWWAQIHRRHHAFTDREGDPHSPHWPNQGARGLWHAHVGWLFDPRFTAMTVSAGKVKDLWSNPCAVRAQRLYLPFAALGLALPALVGAAFGGARGAAMGLLWGGLVRVFLVSHLVWAINSLGHGLGARATMPYSGQATNAWPLALPTLGGGFHANHHDQPRAYTTRGAAWQLDLGGAALWLLARVGVVSNLKERADRSEPQHERENQGSPRP